MFPISRKAAANAQMMQILAPEIKRINDKHKNDLEKRSKAMRELYAKYNHNPFSGCLLMFIQLPIFIGLYKCLSVDIDLREAPLIGGMGWCSNLAGPDMLVHWESWMIQMVGSKDGLLGPYFNILPVATIALFILQQKMFTPPAQDDAQRQQQSIMKFMMIFFAFMFFKVPSGLCLYFIASSLWGIAERKYLPPPKKVTAADAAPSPRSGNAANSRKSRPQPPKKKSKRR